MSQDAYIEIVGAFVNYRHALSKADLSSIGEFTRENISRWLDGGGFFEAGVYGHEDFHAVCGDKDIPWATVSNAALAGLGVFSQKNVVRPAGSAKEDVA
jgi:hypothetical protein